MTAAVTCRNVVDVAQVRPSGVAVVPVVLSRKVAVKKSSLTTSRHVIRNQNASRVPLVTVNVWASEEVRDRAVEPTRAARAPLCTGVVTETVVPRLVQDAKPFSKPPLVSG